MKDGGAIAFASVRQITSHASIHDCNHLRGQHAHGSGNWDYRYGEQGGHRH